MTNHHDEAISFLEDLQREHWREQIESAERAELTEKHMAKLKHELGISDEIDQRRKDDVIEKRKKMFSRYESPEVFWILVNIVEDIETVVQNFKGSNSKNILFGSLATGDINGVAIDFENPEYFIVLIDDGVIGFANLLAKGLAQTFPLESEENGLLRFHADIESVAERINSDTSLSYRLIDLVLGYVVGGSPHKAEPYIPSRKYIGLLSVWRDAMEYFILGHEYGHARLGHLDSRLVALIHRDGYDELPASWQQEFEADHFGLVVTMSCLSKQGFAPSLSYAGIEAFFCGLELIERTLAQFRGEEFSDQGTSTHPPAQLRRAALRKGLEHLVDSEENNSAIGLAGILEKVLDLVKPQLQKVVDDLIQNGIKPHDKWH
jgi:hypothetical protein